MSTKQLHDGQVLFTSANGVVIRLAIIAIFFSRLWYKTHIPGNGFPVGFLTVMVRNCICGEGKKTLFF